MITALCTGLALTLLAQTEPPVGLDSKQAVVRTTLTEVRATPDAYRNVRVAFTAQFVSLGELSNPFFTQFVPSQYANFHAWADEQPIWRRDSFQDVFGQLFLSKSNKQLEELYTLRLYNRIYVEGVVRDVFQGAPWIEVVSFQYIPGQVSTPALAHVYRGEQLMEKRQWQAAITELSMVQGDGVTEHLAAAAAKGLAICNLRMGDSGVAIGYLNRVKNLLGTNADRETERLLATAQSMPQKELDRTVQVQGVKDHERPLWEAFEEPGSQGSSLPSRPQ